jgi:cytochrome b subunit of formate dehydrogenase
MATIARALENERTAEIKRFEVHQIIQHATMMVTFILLVITGLPMKFNNLAISEWWAALWGGISVLRTVHHVSAFVMIGDCVYHVGYIGFSTFVQKKPFPLSMIPTPRDVVTLLQEMAYFLGIRNDAPLFDRFNWKEKFDYWAIFWGVPIMGASGLVLMFPVFATQHLPGWVIPVAYTAHSHEALLALTWIAMVHIFFNHFSPSAFPLNKAIFTGKVPVDRYREEHTLDFEKIINKRE